MSIYEKSVTLKNITRIYGTFKYRLEFDDYVKVRNYSNNRIKETNKFTFKFNSSSTLNQIYVLFYNLFRLRSEIFAKDIKKTIIVCLDYYKLVDLEKKEFSFNSLIGRSFTSCKRINCYDYRKKDNIIVRSNKDKIALDCRTYTNDKLMLEKLLNKLNNDLNYIAKAKKIWKIFRSGVKESLDDKKKEENDKVKFFKKILVDCVDGKCKEYPKFPVLTKRTMIIAFIELLIEERKLLEAKLQQELQKERKLFESRLQQELQKERKLFDTKIQQERSQIVCKIIRRLQKERKLFDTKIQQEIKERKLLEAKLQQEIKEIKLFKVKLHKEIKERKLLEAKVQQEIKSLKEENMSLREDFKRLNKKYKRLMKRGKDV